MWHAATIKQCRLHQMININKSHLLQKVQNQSTKRALGLVVNMYLPDNIFNIRLAYGLDFAPTNHSIKHYPRIHVQYEATEKGAIHPTNLERSGRLTFASFSTPSACLRWRGACASSHVRYLRRTDRGSAQAISERQRRTGLGGPTSLE
jgi:hypothetical protein